MNRRHRRRIIIIFVAISIGCFLFANLKLLLIGTTASKITIVNNNDISQQYGWHPDSTNVWNAKNQTKTKATVVTNTTTTTTTKVLISPFMNRSFIKQSSLRSKRRKQRKVFFIHVGKTGGETVRHTLHITCRMRKNSIEKQKCWDSFKYDADNGTLREEEESELSKSVIGVMHADLILPTKSIDRATTFLWTIRNPIKRIVSWYRYTNPKNCDHIKDSKSTACNTNRLIINNLKKMQEQQQQYQTNNGTIVSSKTIKPKWATKFFEYCFPTLHDFVCGLSSPVNNSTNTTTSTEKWDNKNNSKIHHNQLRQKQHPPPTILALNCSELAWKTISGIASPTSGHAYFNYNYYWENTISKYPLLDVWVIRTEYLWNDVDYIENTLLSNNNVGDDIGSSINIKNSNTNETTILNSKEDNIQQRRQQQQRQQLFNRKDITHGSEGYLQRGIDDDDLSKQNLRYLCYALKDEISIYKNLLVRATNLNPSEKQQAMSNVIQDCGDGIVDDVFNLSSL